MSFSIPRLTKRTREPGGDDETLPAAKRSLKPTADRLPFESTAKPLQWHSQIYKPNPAPKPVWRPYYSWKAKDFPRRRKKPKTFRKNIIPNPPTAQPAAATAVDPNIADAEPSKTVEPERLFRQDTIPTPPTAQPAAATRVNPSVADAEPPKSIESEEKGAITFHRWADLPTELQLKVLRHRLIFDRPITNTLHNVYAHRAVTPLAQTNKAMNALAIQTYYSENLFVLGRIWKMEKAEGYVWTYPHPAVAHWVRYLELKVKVEMACCSDLDRMMADWSEWRHLLRPNEDIANREGSGELSKYHAGNSWTKDSSRWQNYFRKLKELKISLLSYHGWKLCFRKELLPDYVDSDNDGEAARYDLETIVKDATIMVRPKKVEVVCEGTASELCTIKHGATAVNSCQEIFTSIIKGMIQLRGDDDDAESDDEFLDVEFQHAENESNEQWEPMPPKRKTTFVSGCGWVDELEAPRVAFMEAKRKRALEVYEKEQREAYEKQQMEEKKAEELLAAQRKKRRGHRGGKKKRRKGKKEIAAKRTTEGVFKRR
ncbi:hypothetical protein K491DRAFT_773020 [Lophiostoma macrostomum CBS 122681]|uniref:Uncharacterized protein n=1 Tax=Lophiostoma macrostomum CBS 122681 TaxID=1314788 RepID=A0A6A6TSL3_9PLEO|nr:hypothetical protein K491DRAFT_773020 [Lophiostoma macrostomum CBS 122681]